MLTNLPSNIPNFQGQVEKDPSNHIMSLHIWHSSNNIIEDSVHLCLFQQTLMGPVARWYVNEPNVTYGTFEGIMKAFLLFLQLPLRHDIGL